MPAPPTRTPEQRLEALQQALEVRRKQAAVKQDIHTGQRTIGSVLDAGHKGAGDHVLGHMDLGEILLAVNGVGPVHAAQVLAAVEMDPDHHVDQLGVKQVQAFKDAFHEVTGQSAG